MRSRRPRPLLMNQVRSGYYLKQSLVFQSRESTSLLGYFEAMAGLRRLGLSLILSNYTSRFLLSVMGTRGEADKVRASVPRHSTRRRSLAQLAERGPSHIFLMYGPR